MAGAGQQLAQARQAKGLSTAQVADKLKLTIRQVEALEAEDFSRLPSAVFVRGFLRNYAKLLGINPESLQVSQEVRQVPTETITAPSEDLALSGSSVRRWLVLPLLAFALFVLMVAALYYWLRQGESNLGSEPTPAPTIDSVSVSPPTEVVTLPAPVAEPAQPAVAGGQSASESLPPAQPAPAASPTPAVPAVPTAPVAPVQPAASVPSAPVAVSGNGAASLRFRAEQDAWIQVQDGSGQSYRNLVKAGESAVLRGTPPFRLVVGNAATVRLEYNNRPIDLKPFIGEKVARLTLE